MSEREQVIAMLDRVPEYKLGYVLAYIQGITADEDEDDAFCQQLYERYQNDPGDNIALWRFIESYRSWAIGPQCFCISENLPVFLHRFC